MTRNGSSRADSCRDENAALSIVQTAPLGKEVEGCVDYLYKL